MTARRDVLIGAAALAATGVCFGISGIVMPRRAASDELDAAPWAKDLVTAALTQVGVTLRYDPAYVRLDYPMGDIPRSGGVCTDVIVRAYRDSFSIDLQKLVHEDMRRAFSAYPNNWNLSRP
ncbi:MAG: DUF1287 domain-containing protein, partial [Hyphomicrobiales bacterium]|nr:DUF1287 domain-containing protein [Hyphomicrobiales bacterium]